MNDLPTWKLIIPTSHEGSKILQTFRLQHLVWSFLNKLVSPAQSSYGILLSESDVRILEINSGFRTRRQDTIYSHDSVFYTCGRNPPPHLWLHKQKKTTLQVALRTTEPQWAPGAPEAQTDLWRNSGPDLNNNPPTGRHRPAAGRGSGLQSGQSLPTFLENRGRSSIESAESGSQAGATSGGAVQRTWSCLMAGFPSQCVTLFTRTERGSCYVTKAPAVVLFWLSLKKHHWRSSLTNSWWRFPDKGFLLAEQLSVRTNTNCGIND